MFEHSQSYWWFVNHRSPWVRTAKIYIFRYAVEHKAITVWSFGKQKTTKLSSAGATGTHTPAQGHLIHWLPIIVHIQVKIGEITIPL